MFFKDFDYKKGSPEIIHHKHTLKSPRFRTTLMLIIVGYTNNCIQRVNT